MLSFAQKLAIALMLCIAVLVARLDQTSFPTHEIKKTEAADSYDDQSKWKKWREPLTIVTLLLVAVGLGQLGLFWRQLRETKILQRAYITAKPMGINPFISEQGNVPDRIVGHVAFINVGRLPARSVSVERACMKWAESDDLQEKDFPLPEYTRPMTIVLPPGTEMRHGTNNIEASDLDKPGYIYVWGCLRYTDGFDTTRHTKFCHRYPCRPHKSTAEGKSISRLHARYHQHGNDAD